MTLSPSLSCLRFLRQYTSGPVSRQTLLCELCGSRGWKRQVGSLPLSEGSLTWCLRTVSRRIRMSKRYLGSATGDGGGDGLATFSRRVAVSKMSATGNGGGETTEERLVGGTKSVGCTGVSVDTAGHGCINHGDAGARGTADGGGQRSCQSVSETAASSDVGIKWEDYSRVGGLRERDSESSDSGADLCDSRLGSVSSGYESDVSGSESDSSGLESDSSDSEESEDVPTGHQTDGLGSSSDHDSGSISQAKAGSINLSDLPRTKDGGILVYPDIHLHGKQAAHSRDKPHPQDIGDLAESSTTRRREHDLHSLLYNIQKSRTKQEQTEKEKRTTAMSVEELVDFLKEENAKDICVIELPPELNYVRYFVICSGMGSRHIGRMADNLQAELKRVRVGREQRRVQVEGRDSVDWMAVDMGTMVVHFMLKETRERYELEKLWTLGEDFDDQCRQLKLAAAEQDEMLR